MKDMHKLRLARFIFWFFFINTIVFWLLGSTYLQSILHSTTLFKNFLADYSGWTGRLFVLMFTLTNYCSFMMLLAVIPAAPAIITLLILPRSHLIQVISIVSTTVSILWLFIDSQVYSMFKFHVNFALVHLIVNGDVRAVFDFSYSEILFAIGFIFALLCLESGVAWFIWQKIMRSNKYFQLEKCILTCWLGSLLFSYFALMLSVSQQNNLLIQQAPNIPFLNQFIAYTLPGKQAFDELTRYSEGHYTDALYARDQLNYPRHAMQCHLNQPYNIILIMVDSLRFDSLRFMPTLAEFAKNNWQFNQHLSGGNATQSGLFSLFYSIPSNYWTAALEQKKQPVLLELLKQNRYQMQVFWSSEMHNPPLDKVLYRDLQDLNTDGAPGEDVANWDRYTTQKAIGFLNSQNASQKPFFLNLFYNAPHAFCRTQNFPAVFKPITRSCSRIGMNNQTDPTPLYNNYLNAVSFIDSEIAKVLQVITAKGYAKNSVIIFTSDHGQEFNDNKQNYWGHAGNYTPVQVQVPLIVHWPGEMARTIDYLTTGYDIVPTLLTRLFACQNTLTDYSIGEDLLHNEGRLPFVLAGSYVNMGIIEKDQIMVLETSGHINIMTKKAEPIQEAKPQLSIFNQALALMRLYYL